MDQFGRTVGSMRKEIYRMDGAAAALLLARAPVVHVATTTSSGAPLLRAVHGVVVGPAIAFHGAPAGEKTETVGREAVVAAEEIVATIPSYFVDPERACPATTYYRSVQVHGRIERVEAPADKAAVLATLMAKYQPEGGYPPIEHKDVSGLLVLRVPFERIDGKGKLGQNRSPAELARVLERLWKRGLPGDPAAIDAVRAANPRVPTPSFLAAPEGISFRCALGRDDVAETVDLLAGAYWNEGFSRRELEDALLASSAWVGARDLAGRLVATARALADDSKVAWIYDVFVAPEHRGRRLGAALLRLLLDHPRVRRARWVRLSTKDQQGFYARLGFLESSPTSRHPWRSIEMILTRSHT